MDLFFPTGFRCPKCGKTAKYKTTFWKAFTEGPEKENLLSALDEVGGYLESETCGHGWEVEPGSREMDLVWR